MSRVLDKLVGGFRFSLSSTTTLLLSNSGKSSLGGVLNKNCGCIGGGLSWLSTSSRLKLKNSTPTSGSTVPARKEEEDVERSERRTGVNTTGLDNKSKEPKSGQVFRHGRHNMYVCWHPEVPFPYEMTKPIDLNAPVTDSHLKIQALTPVKEAFRQKHHKLTIQELIKLTYSTKHRFYGQFGKKKRTALKEMDPNKERRNREYL